MMATHRSKGVAAFDAMLNPAMSSRLSEIGYGLKTLHGGVICLKARSPVMEICTVCRTPMRARPDGRTKDGWIEIILWDYPPYPEC